jgi:hypothetical protein
LLDLGTRALRMVDGLGDRHVVEVVQRPDGGPLAVISWATPEIDPGASAAELHVVDPQTLAVHDLGPLDHAFIPLHADRPVSGESPAAPARGRLARPCAVLLRRVPPRRLAGLQDEEQEA